MFMTLEVRQTWNLWIRGIKYKFQEKKQKEEEKNTIWNGKLSFDF